ncbi:peptidase inhibitor family I36 protein [Cellulomonas soli]|uniref:Peptidase inhibitor family I36 n=1 Tax=Cellulomonas soli TaxID=931535 RepID=A0A512PEI3_9CELL|nr:peptidase inhibitor family I36 protein [Cellulomonas soli]NYI58886.1 hypothetical protein [Cellulomonas soli]GEP69621.1 hypothetical protein CSO01_23360 [Cellulomonas soli]
MSIKMGKPSRARRAVSALVAATALVGGAVAMATPASAAPSCTASYVCFWTGADATGSKYSYQLQANHTFTTASVYYNYNTDSISFWTGSSGTGDLITHYTTSQRGFRNWSTDNWDRCRSHQNHY